MSRNPVIIVGGGLSGLACARALEARGVEQIEIFEAASKPGGRVRTDEVDGYLLDRGFQVYLSDYQEAGRMLDLEALDLHAFEPGALVHRDGRWHQLCDPFRAASPGEVIQSVKAPIGTLADKLRVGTLRLSLGGDTSETPAVFATERKSTRDFLLDYGFSERMLADFFEPFYGGVFLERELATSAAMFRLTFGAFARGVAALPSRGMEAIPAQLAAQLRHTAIHCGKTVDEVGPGHVRVAGEGRREAAAVVLAVESPAAARLQPDYPAVAGKPVTCLYYTVPEPPWHEPMVALDAEPGTPIQTLVAPGLVAPGYSPGSRELISVSVLGSHDPDTLRKPVENRLHALFPAIPKGEWQFLRAYRVRHALPVTPPGYPKIHQPPEVIFLAGDHRVHGSIEGAILSGRQAADQIISHLG